MTPNQACDFLAAFYRRKYGLFGVYGLGQYLTEVTFGPLHDTSLRYSFCLYGPHHAIKVLVEAEFVITPRPLIAAQPV